MTSLQISLFGEMNITYDEHTITTVNTTRLQSLLAYLLLHRKTPQRRETLCYLFWPDSTDRQAHTNLRNLVHLLRRALPNAEQFVEITNHTIQWNNLSTYTLDIVAFDQFLDEANTAKWQGNTFAMVRALEQVIALYHGDLLTSCYADWIIPERERLRLRFMTALDDVIDQLEAKRAYHEAIPYLQRQLRMDPLREELYQRLIQLHLLVGDRASALHVYHLCALTLERELGIEPGQPLRDTHARLLRVQDSDTIDTITTPSIPSSIQLVGRIREWAQLQATWRSLKERGAHIIMLWGEAGIGKTRLAEELLRWVQRLGYPATTTRCYAAEGNLPYEPIASWLRSDSLRPVWSRLPDMWLKEVSRIVPEIIDSHAHHPSLEPLRESWQRTRLFQGIAHAVTLIQEPQLLTIDDLQWCDQDSLEWLHYLMRVNLSMPVLIVGTARQEDFQEDHPLHRLLMAMRQQDLVTEIELTRLNEAETISLTTQIIGHSLDPLHTSELYRNTEGNPLFVVELARMINQDQERGVPGIITSLPSRVRAVLAARLASLSPVGRELSGLAATIGRDFTFAVLQHAIDYDEGTLVRGIDELRQRRIIRELDANTTYVFSHDKLREVTYTELSVDKRQFWHRRIARALETVYAHQLDFVAAQIARNDELGGLWERAVVSYEQAASAARAVYANAEAMSLLRRALALLAANLVDAQDEPRHIPTIADLHTQLAEILLLSGSFEAARDEFSEALRHIPTHTIVKQARLRFAIGETWHGQQHFVEALQCYDQAQSTLDHEAGVRDEAWRHLSIAIQINRVWANYFLGQIQELPGLIAQLEPTVKSSGTPAQNAIFVGCIAALRIGQERHLPSNETVGYLRQALELHELSASSLQDTATIRFGLGYALLWRGEFDASEKYMRQALQEAHQLGDSLLLVRGRTFLSVLARRRQQREAVQQESEQLLLMAEQGQLYHFEAIAHANLAWCTWRRGLLAESESYSRTALEKWGPLQRLPYQWLALWPLIAVLSHRNQTSEALRYAQVLLQPEQQQLPQELEALLNHSLQAWESNKLKAAHIQLERALTLAQQLAYLLYMLAVGSWFANVQC